MVIVKSKCRDMKNNISHLFSETNIAFVCLFVCLFVFVFFVFVLFLFFVCLFCFVFLLLSSADYNVLEKF